MRKAFLLIFLFILTPTAGYADSEGFRDWEEKPPVIFIPGIMGSKLREVGRKYNIWGSLLGANTNNLRKIILDPQNKHQRQIESYEILDEFDLFPFPFKNPVYKGIVDLLTDKLGYEVGKDLFLFHYDWRLSPKVGAKELVQKMHQWQRLVKGKKFTIIAHSLGGLVTEYAVNAEGADEMTNMIITQATPIRGSASIFHILNDGLTKESFGVALNDQLGAEVVKEMLFWNPSTYALLAHDGVPSLYLSEEPGREGELFSIDPDSDVHIVEEVDVSTPEFMTKYITARFGENGRCVGECNRRLQFVLRELENAREVWDVINLNHLDERFGEQRRLKERLQAIPRFRILSGMTNEAATLQGVLFDFFNLAPKGLLSSFAGDGRVSPEGAMTKEQAERFEYFNERFRVFVDPETGMIDTFSIESPKFLYYYKEFEDYDPSPLHPYGEFLASLGGLGFALEEMTTFKTVSSVHHTIFTKESSFDMVAQILRNANNHYVTAPLWDGAFYSFFAEFENLGDLRFSNGLETTEEIVIRRLHASLKSYVNFAYDGLPLFMLNWVREMTNRYQRVKFSPVEVAPHNASNRALKLGVEVYLLDEEEPVLTFNVQSEGSNLHVAFFGVFVKAFKQIDKRIIVREGLVDREVPPVDYRFSFPELGEFVLASLDVNNMSSFYQRHDFPRGRYCHVAEDFVLREADYYRIFHDAFDELLPELSKWEKVNLLRNLQRYIGGKISNLYVTNNLKKVSDDYFYEIRLTIPELRAGQLSSYSNLTVKVRNIGNTLSFLRLDHEEAVAKIWKEWLLELAAWFGE